ncbi:ATP-grasp domain-containing protein [Streptomyces sp. NRRL F-5126]|uniref:ATP-grasp domain-containing protein n=1 Tax=Streptomyces sp. NRRL F-5126 TaxID=1463857 RepID=UPI000ADF34F1|nr:ATP-grasp domain-containing protein [Streptomyces sp. NRRL F-5126]
MGAESSAVEDLLTAAKDLDITVHLATHRDVYDRYPPELRDALAGVVFTDFRAPRAALEELVRYAEEHRIGGVVAGWEFLSLTATRLAGRLGLPGHDVAGAEAARNKWEMALAFAEHRVPSPRSLAAVSAESAAAAVKAAGWDFPLVVKPAENAGSVGVTVVGSFAELPAAFAAARAWTAEFPYGIPLDTSVLVQEYLHGPEFSVESVVADGHAVHLAVTRKLTTGGDIREELGHTVPAELDAGLRERILDTAERALSALGLRNGVAHTELKATPDGPRVIEVGARPPGGHIVKVVEQALGVSETRAYLQVAVGLAPDVTPSRHEGAAIRFLTTEDCGTFAGLTGPADRPGVAAVQAYMAPGDPVDHAHERHSRVGHVLVRATSAADADRIAEEVAADVAIRVEPPR